MNSSYQSLKLSSHNSRSVYSPKSFANKTMLRSSNPEKEPEKVKTLMPQNKIKAKQNKSEA